MAPERIELQLKMAQTHPNTVSNCNVLTFYVHTLVCVCAYAYICAQVCTLCMYLCVHMCMCPYVCAYL